VPAVIENAGLARRFDGRTVAVTGASGLIGGALTRTFAQAQVPVRALDVREPPAWDGPLTLRLVDVRQADLLAEAVAGADYVFHEAGWKVPASDRDPAAAIDVLIQGTLNVAAACVATGAKLVFASTGAIRRRAVPADRRRPSDPVRFLLLGEQGRRRVPAGRGRPVLGP